MCDDTAAGREGAPSGPLPRVQTQPDRPPAIEPTEQCHSCTRLPPQLAFWLVKREGPLTHKVTAGQPHRLQACHPKVSGAPVWSPPGHHQLRPGDSVRGPSPLAGHTPWGSVGSMASFTAHVPSSGTSGHRLTLHWGAGL